MNRRHEIALADSHGAVKDYFIAVRRPGCAPITKKPPEPTSAGAQRMLIELLKYNPDAHLTFIRLTWDDDLWIDDGHAVLTEAAHLGAITLPNGAAAKFRISDAGISVWTQMPDQRPRKGSGPHRTSREALADIYGRLWSLTPTQGGC